MDARSSFETKVLAAFAAAVLVVVMLAATTWKVAQDADEAALRVSRTHEVLANLAQARGDTHLIELSTQSYRISGDAARLAERDAAISARENSLRRIRELTAGDARQQERFTRLREVVEERLAISRRTELLRKIEGQEAASAYVASAPLRETRERLLQELGEMEQEERRLLQERSASQARVREIMLATGTLAALALVALLAATYLLIRRQMRATEASRRALELANARIELIFDSVGEGLHGIDLNGKIIFENPAAVAMLGWNLHELIGQPAHLLMHHTRANGTPFPQNECPIYATLRDGAPRRVEDEVFWRKDGTSFPVAYTSTPMRNDAGELIGSVVAFRDITERKRAEQTIRVQNEQLEQRIQERTAQLRESEERLRLIVDNVNDYAILMLDPAGHIVTWNAGAARIKGYAADEIIGRHFSAFYPPEVVASTRPEAALAMAQKNGRFEEEGLRVRKDDSTFWANVVITPIRNPAGDLIGFATITRDITERRRAEVALRESEDRYRQIIQTSMDGFWIVDAGGRIREVNAAYCELSGYTREELLNMQIPDLESKEAAEQTAQHIREIMTIGHARFETRHRSRDGKLRDIEVQTVYHADIEDGRFFVFLHDVTERKRAEQEIRDLNASLERRVAERTLQLEEANRAKSDFLANMSHELRTPLNSIIGFSEMLKDGVLGELEAKQRAFVVDIFDAGTHLLSLINDILDLSKVEAGMLQLETAAVDVSALLKASTLIVREKALAHRIELDTRIDPGLGSMLADERKLKQIVYNLLSNAVKFTPDGGTVTLGAVRCPRAEVALDPALPGRLIALPPSEDDEFLAIAVEDSGVGVAEEDLPKLFEAFTQVDSSLARRQAGTGLGLSLVRRLAELHGGTVGVVSRPGTGSRFCVWLPYRAAEPAVLADHAAPETAAPSAPAVPLALVVEDDDRMAELIAAQLRAEGYDVMRAATGEEGLVRAAKSKPQLITLDIFLPAMDGWEFMRRLKADPKLADTPVAIITVSKDLSRGLALGARRVLQKPFLREELAAALAGLVDARSNGEPARVLVVDDNVKAVELLATALEAEGYRVLRAYGGAEAIEVARSARPDLVILDLVMPEVSGFEVARALRETEHTARIPILVLTAKDLTAEDHARLNGGVSAILAKSSFSTSDLLAELRRALPKRPVFEETHGQRSG